MNPIGKILIVDDEPDFRLILSDIFSRAGYSIKEAPNGKQAFAILQKEPPDLMVVDWNMPELSGPELCQKVRQDPKLSKLLIIMLTVRQQDADQAEGLHQGADLYLTKPIKPDELLARVKTLLRRA